MLIFSFPNLKTGILIATCSTLMIAPPLFGWVFSIILQLHETEKKLFQLSHYDALTELANRYYLFTFAEQLLKRCRRSKSTVSLLILDVDFFKKYNDHYGHIAGDKCLQKIGDILSLSVNRPDDLAARFGGEEFLVILGNTDLKGALTIAKSIQNNLKSLKILHQDSGLSDYVTMSIGCSASVIGPETSLNELLKSADKQLYEAKKQGRNRICSQTTAT